MDWLMGRFAESRVAGMPPQILTEFERLLQMPDPELHDMILYPEIAPAGDFAALIAELRSFHGLQ